MTQKSIPFLLILVLMLLFSLAACQSAPVATPTLQTEPTVIVPETVAPSPGSETAASTAIAPTQQETAYPVPQPYPLYTPYIYPGITMPLSGYPYPELNPAAAAEPYVFKTSEPGTATLHGVLLVTDPMQSRPKDADSLYLVPLAGEDVMTIPPFEVGKVPQAEVNELTGEFTFTNIAPGRYAVVVLTAGDAQIPARFFEQGSFAIVRVEESDLGQTIELDYIFI